MKSLIYFFSIFVIISAKDYANKLDRYLIACHSTDSECFKRQYKALRDNFLLGNDKLAIKPYHSYTFSYGDSGTCVKISGVEESELAGISMNSNIKEYTIVLELPIKIQQIKGYASCDKPDKQFGKIGPHKGSFKKFSGNATITVTYPYTLTKNKENKNKIHMILGDETMDVVLDIPNLSQYDRESELETKLFEWSEWAYEMIQHVDVAQHCFVPYTGKLRQLMERVPIEKLLMLYPDEEYTDLQFSFNTDNKLE